MSIHFDSTTKTFYLEGKNITYAFFINSVGYAEHLYFGKRISRDFLLYTRTDGGRSAATYVPGVDPEADSVKESYHSYPSELSFYGNSDFREPTVQVENAEGDRLCELLYDGHEILAEKPRMLGMPSMRGGETLVLHLRDAHTDFCADLYYTVYDDTSVIARRTVYRNERDEKLRLRRAYSFNLPLPSQNYEVLSLWGMWARERRTQRIPIHHGVVSIDSKRISSSATLNPFIAVMEKGANETRGEVFGVNLVYSSSFVLKVEGINDGQAQICGGINDFDFSWTLGAGESLETPEIVLAYSSEGLGGMSRALHDAYREHLINPRFVKKSRPIVINNWEGTYFDFNNERLIAIADAVAGTGIDTFVLDDGWFGKRDSDRSGLGDWVVNEKKLVGGLKPVVDHVHSLGMKFGLWFEPEMISEDSDIFRAHPEYAIGVPGRERCYSRHQFVMDITREDVRDYIADSVNRIIREYGVDYVKWDFNRRVTECFSLHLPSERQAEFAHRYALGLYELCERIIEANPDVLFEGCAGGGARFDPAMLYYFPQIWTSDNTDAEDRTFIQYGTSLAYPLSSMSCHVSEVPNHQTGRITDIKTRADIAHLGATGYELDTSSFTDEDRALTRAQVEEYKAMESLVLEGDLYRTDDPNEGNYFGFMLVSKDKSRAVLTCYCRLTFGNSEIKRFKAQGLDPKKRYFVPELNLILSGDTLMSVGLVPRLPYLGDFKTYKFHFEEK